MLVVLDGVLDGVRDLSWRSWSLVVFVDLLDVALLTACFIVIIVAVHSIVFVSRIALVVIWFEALSFVVVCVLIEIGCAWRLTILNQLACWVMRLYLRGIRVHCHSRPAHRHSRQLLLVVGVVCC